MDTDRVGASAAIFGTGCLRILSVASMLNSSTWKRKMPSPQVITDLLVKSLAAKRPRTPLSRWSDRRYNTLSQAVSARPYVRSFDDDGDAVARTFRAETELVYIDASYGRIYCGAHHRRRSPLCVALEMFFRQLTATVVGASSFPLEAILRESIAFKISGLTLRRSTGRCPAIYR